MSASNAPDPPATPADLVRRGREFLARKGVESARLEAELLVAHALGVDRLRLFLEHDRPLGPDEVARARELLVRRGQREPTAYLTGRREFYGRSFQVGPGALIPRPETELLVDRAREIARERAAAGAPLRCAADFGTGSGCLAITLALEIDGLDVYGVEVSGAALAWARRNLAALCTPEQAARVELALGDGFELLGRRARASGGFDLVVANPPYVERAERDALAPEVRDHEPESALFAPGEDPDHFLRRLLAARSELLAPAGALLVELGHRQGARARELAVAAGATVRVARDHGGIDRVLEARRDG